jgi:hypothetical protein
MRSERGFLHPPNTLYARRLWAAGAIRSGVIALVPVVRRPLAAVLSAVLVLVPAACGGDDDDDETAGEVTLELVEQNGSRQEGTAILTPNGAGGTTVAIELSNPPDVPQPSHIHSGTCDDIGDVVAPLENLVAGRSETDVDMSIDELRSKQLIVHAHKSEAEFDVSVACSAIPGT